MIIKSKVGSGFKGTIMYQYEGRKNENDKDKRSEILMSNEVYLPKSHDDKDGRKEMIKSFVQHAKELNPNFKNVVQHTVISFAKEDEKKIDEDLMKNVVGDYLKKAGLQNSQYVVFIHNDTDHKHLHIVANRIDLNGKTVSDRYIKMRDVERANIISRKYGLHQTLSNEVSKSKRGNEYNKVKEKRELNLSKINLDKLNGADKARLGMYRDISLTLQSKKSENIVEFQKQLTEKGIKVNFYEKDAKIYGISFEKDGYNISGSKIDKNFSYGKLIGHFNLVEKELHNNRYQKILEQIGKGQNVNRTVLSKDFQVRLEIRDTIKDVLSQRNSSYQVFEDRLKKEGISSVLQEKDGKIVGVSFEKEGLKYHSKEIDGKLSIKSILHDLSKNIEKTDRDKEQNQAVTTGNSVLDELARLQSGKPMKKGKTKDISRGR